MCPDQCSHHSADLMLLSACTNLHIHVLLECHIELEYTFKVVRHCRREPVRYCNKWPLSQSQYLDLIIKLSLIWFRSSEFFSCPILFFFSRGATTHNQKGARFVAFRIPDWIRTSSVLFSTYKSSFSIRLSALWQAPATMTLKEINVVLSRKLPYICMKITYICHGWWVAY